MANIEFENVTALAKANVYFDGKVVSHTIILANENRKTLGLIYPGSFHFGTEQAERMEIIAGTCGLSTSSSSTKYVKLPQCGKFSCIDSKFNAP